MRKRRRSIDQVFCRLDKESSYGSSHKEKCNHDSCLKQELFRATPLIERGGEVVATKSPSEVGTALLKHDSND